MLNKINVIQRSMNKMLVVTLGPVGSPLLDQREETDNLFLVKSLLGTIFIEHPLPWAEGGLSEL